jgi:hypothetical protein
MKNPDTSKDELDDIRVKLYEQTKNMDLDEHTEFFSNIAKNAAKKYGFTFINDISEGIYNFEKRQYSDKMPYTEQRVPADYAE